MLFDVDVDTDFCADIPVIDFDTGMQSKSSVGMDEVNQKQSAMSNGVPKSARNKKQRSSSKRLAGRGPAELDGLNALLMTIEKRKSAELAATTETNQTGDKVSKMVSLMTNCKSAREAMGCPIKAAYSCPEFEQFLDRKERKQLHWYHREKEDPLSLDSSD